MLVRQMGVHAVPAACLDSAEQLIPVNAKNNPFLRAFALQSSGRNCAPPPDLVLSLILLLSLLLLLLLYYYSNS